MHIIPADVPTKHRDLFLENFNAITRAQHRLFLFTADHKIEHLHKDFYGSHIDPQAAHTEHLFKIAQAAPIGAFATQLGLIARYGKQYPHINYIVKLNSKTDIMEKHHSVNLVCTHTHDPISKQLWSVGDVIDFKASSQLPIRGVGYTLYIGSAYEHEMLTQAAQIVYHAHQAGLVAMLWIYPRGAHVSNELDYQLLAGAAGVAQALGADIVKIKAPKANASNLGNRLKIIKQAAGNTLLVLAGGTPTNQESFVTNINNYVATNNIDGIAVGRNIFQHSVDDAVALTKKLESMIYRT